MDIILQCEKKSNGLTEKFANKPDNISMKQSKCFINIRVDNHAQAFEVNTHASVFAGTTYNKSTDCCALTRSRNRSKFFLCYIYTLLPLCFHLLHIYLLHLIHLYAICGCHRLLHVQARPHEGVRNDCFCRRRRV